MSFGYIPLGIHYFFQVKQVNLEEFLLQVRTSSALILGRILEIRLD